MIHNDISIIYSDANTVDEEDVIKYWLKLELDKSGDSIGKIDNLSKPQLVDKLMRYASGETHILWKESGVDWYEAQLTEQDFHSLKSITSPDGIGWSRLADDYHIVECAQRIIDGDVNSDTTDLVDVGYIKQIVSELPQYSMKKIIIKTAESTSAPRVIDGNHHAVASAIHYLQTGDLPPIRAYIGVNQVSIFKTIAEKMRYIMGQIALWRHSISI